MKDIAKKSEPKFLHSDVKHLLPVNTNVWLEFLLPTVAQQLLGFQDNYSFTQGQVGLDNLSPLINEIIT